MLLGRIRGEVPFDATGDGEKADRALHRPGHHQVSRSPPTFVPREFLKMALELFQPSLFRKLEEQLKETQVAKDELVAQQQELHEMMIRLANLL